MMTLNFAVVIGSIVLGGLAGGTVNYLNLQEEKGWRAWFKQILLSTVAALLVPLFLALAKSSLLDSLLGSEDPLTSSEVFVFLGFCIAGGIASNRFIVSLSERVIQEIKQTKEEVKEIREQTEPLLEQMTEPEDDGRKNEENVRQEIGEEEKKVLKALAHPRYKLRSISGIMVETGLPRDEVEKILRELKSKGLVIEVSKTRRKGIRWALSGRGFRFLDET